MADSWRMDQTVSPFRPQARLARNTDGSHRSVDWTDCYLANEQTYRPAAGDLVDVRVGDRGTANEWRGPGVVRNLSSGGEALSIDWCDAYGAPTGGGQCPGAQNVRPTTAPTAIPPRSVDPATDRCRRVVEKIAESTGEAWTFGYIGNVSHAGDFRSWYAFRPHPGRVGGRDDRIGGYGTEDLDKLLLTLRGALVMSMLFGGKTA